MRTLFRTFIALFLWIWMIGCDNGDPGSTPDPDPPANPMEWLEQKSTPITTVEAGTNFSDLQGLKDIIGSAQIVTIGEATSGTKEFAQMKHRLIAFLVQEMGFNTLIMDVSMAEAFPVDDYLTQGFGQPASLLANLKFWRVQTEEVQTLLTWANTHNQTATDKLRFFGADVYFPALVIDGLIAYLQQVAPDQVAQFQQDYACVEQFETLPDRYANTRLPFRTACQASVAAAHTRLSDQAAALTALSSADTFALALQYARFLVQWEDLFRGTTGFKRDTYLAENADWILQRQGPNTKAIIWTHNIHAANAPGRMGQLLRQVHDYQEVIIGQGFYTGQANAIALHSDTGILGELGPHPIPAPTNAESYEAFFHQNDDALFFTDLRGLTTGSGSDLQIRDGLEWLRLQHPFRSIGSAYDRFIPNTYFDNRLLPLEFDVLIFFQTTAPSTFLSNQAAPFVETR